MEWVFRAQEAQFLYGLLASIVVPFVVSFIAKEKTSKGVKVALALGVSVIGGFLTEYAGGKLESGSVVLAIGGVFLASQAHFSSWFKGLGLDEMLLAIGS